MPEGKCESTSDGVYLTVFPVYMWLVNENWGFKNTNVNRPFLNHRKPLLSGWVGGWWYFGSFGFFLKSGIIRSKLFWFQIWRQSCLRPLDQKLWASLSLKMWNFKADFRGGNQLKIMIVTKDIFSRRKLRKV